MDLIDDSYLRENYKKDIKILGKGGFGVVYLVERLNKKGLIALKVIETREKDAMNSALKELTNLSRLKNNENVLSYENYFLNTVPLEGGCILFQILIEMEAGENTLAQILLTMDKQRLPEKIFTDYFKQICNGLYFAHNLQCVHLDIKPENILIFKNTCKLADWGGSLQLKSQKTTFIKSSDLAISVGYVAPEIEDENYGDQEKFNYYACDIYSLGILGFKLLGITKKEINTLPKNKEKYHDETISEFCAKLKSIYSGEILDLLKYMCSFNAEARPNIGEVKEILKSGF